MQFDSKTYRVTGGSKFVGIALVVGLIGLGISAAGAFGDNQSQFAHSYLVALVFWTAIGLGALGFVMIHNLVNMRWGIVIRRIQESVMFGLPVMFILFLPLIGLLVTGKLHDLYPWTDSAVMNDTNVVVWGKRAWLNSNFFAGRTVFYFALWSVLTLTLWKLSRKQDEEGPSEGLVNKVRTISGPGMVIFALSLTFASFDWLMSIQPTWYSTMFGVYLFSMSVLSMWCFMGLMVTFLRSQGVLKNELSIHHYHDIGKWMFAFVVFWAYIAFCQFMLIWYANIPEETEFYGHRWMTGWRNWTYIIVLGHFAFPFLMMISRIPKRSGLLVTVMAVWLLVMHWAELYWLVMPNLHHSVHLHWLDFSTLFGVGGVFVATVLWRLTSAPVVPVKDPYLKQSVAFVNA